LYDQLPSMPDVQMPSMPSVQPAVDAAMPLVDSATGSAKAVYDRLKNTDVVGPLETMFKDAGSALQDLPQELMDAAPSMPSMPDMSGLQDLPADLVDLKDQALESLKGVAPSIFGTPTMAPEQTPEGYMPSSGLTVAPKGGVTREGTQDDVAVQQLLEGSGMLPMNREFNDLTAGQSFKRALGDSLLDLGTAIPALPWEMINLPITGMAAGADWLGYGDIAEGLREGQENPGVLWPLKKLADVSTSIQPEQVRAVTDVYTGQKPSYGQALKDQIKRTEDSLTQNPLSHASGRFFGPAGSVLLGKGAGAKGLQRLDRALDVGIDAATGANRAFKAGERIDRFKFGKGPTGQKLKKAFANATENSIEGMAMAIANDGDPAFGAGVGAGTSLGADATNRFLDFLNPVSGVKGITPVGKFMGEMAGAFTTMYAIQQLTPGDENVFDAIESSSEKALLAFAVSMLSKGGGGRLERVGSAGKIMPHFTEAISGTPRTFLNSFVNLQMGAPRQDALNGMRATFEGAETLTPERRRELVTMMNDDPEKALQEFIRIGQGFRGQAQ
jgi:hypothetical protein